MSGSRQADYLGGRSRSRAAAPEEEGGRLSGSDPRVRAWEDGPWPGAPIPSPPAEFFVLWRHVTGRELSGHDFEILERIRCHVGYVGPVASSGPELREALQRALAAAPGRAAETVEEIPEDLGGLDDFGDVSGRSG